MNKGWAVFLDRDGTLIHLVPYLRDPDNVRLHDGVPEALRLLRAAGARLILVTNQAGIARGLMTRRDVDRVNRRLGAALKAEGVKLDRIEVCPHHPDFSRACTCRKPEAGMLRNAAGALDIDLAESWIVGDSETDLAAGYAAGCSTALVLTGYGRKTRGTRAGRGTTLTGGTMRALARAILAYRGRGRR